MSQLGIIVFSRMKSTRLSGKALMKIQGEALVLRVIKRAQLTGYPVVLATSDMQEDDALESEMAKANIPCFRGSEDNVLERAVLAAEQFGFSAFARLCGDRPLFSVDEMKLALLEWEKADGNNKPDLITNNYPNKCVRGLTTEVVHTQALRKQLDNQPDAEEKEHLTLGFYRNPVKYHILSLPQRYQHWQNHSGFAVDTEEDYQLIKKFIAQNSALDYEL